MWDWKDFVSVQFLGTDLYRAPHLCVSIISRINISLILTPIRQKLRLFLSKHFPNPRKRQIHTRRNTRTSLDIAVNHPSSFGHPFDIGMRSFDLSFFAKVSAFRTFTGFPEEGKEEEEEGKGGLNKHHQKPSYSS